MTYGNRTERARTAEGIFQDIERRISEGVYRPDEPLPSIRDLARELHVSPATVAAAFRKLADRGLTYVERGVGTRVRNEALLVDTLGRVHSLSSSGIVDVASGSPDPVLLPKLQQHLRRISVPTTLYDVEPLLATLADRASECMEDAIDGRATHLTITSGALDSLADAIAVRLRPGDRVIVEDPGFAAANSLLRSHALQLVPVPVDDAGFLEAPFASALKHGAAAVLYSPRAQNPLGAALTEERAQALRAMLREHSVEPVCVIENDHASLVSDAPYVSLTQASDAWICTRSLSKSHGPDLRFAFVAGDPLTIDRMRRRQTLHRGWLSTITQRLVVDLLGDSEVTALVKNARSLYASRRSRLEAALRDAGVAAFGRSGLNVLVPVEDEGSVSNALLARGWQVRNGQAYRHTTGPFIRLTPAALADDRIDALAKSVRAVMHGDGSIFR